MTLFDEISYKIAQSNVNHCKRTFQSQMLFVIFNLTFLIIEGICTYHKLAVMSAIGFGLFMVITCLSLIFCIENYYDWKKEKNTVKYYKSLLDQYKTAEETFFKSSSPMNLSEKDEFYRNELIRSIRCCD